MRVLSKKYVNNNKKDLTFQKNALYLYHWFGLIVERSLLSPSKAFLF